MSYAVLMKTDRGDFRRLRTFETKKAATKFVEGLPVSKENYKIEKAKVENPE